MNKRTKAIYAVAGLAAASWLPTGAYAQAPEQSVAGAIEEVLVTARRREESLQEVPIAISAFGGEDLTQRGVDSVQNMNAIAPNLSVMGGGATGESQGSFRVRGIPGVSVYIDGVYQASTDGLLTTSVVEVDRIEVLRGPQGTLFGNSSLGGAVHYITKAPGDTFGGRVQATAGSFNRRDFQFAVDVPLTDTFSSKLTFASQSRDGFVNSQVIDRAYGDVNDELYRADFMWKPIDGLSIRYNAEQANTNRDGPARVVRNIGAATYFPGTNTSSNPQIQAYQNVGVFYNNVNNASGFAGGNVGEYETRIGWENPGLVIDVQRHSLDANWDINDSFHLRSISGYRETTRAVQTDFDGAQEVRLLERDFRARSMQFSQELQLLGTHDSFDWVVGAYYSKENNRTRTITWGMPEFTCDQWSGGASNNLARTTAAERASCLALRNQALAGGQGVTAATFSGAAGSNSDSMTRVRPETTAIFGDLTWRVTDKFSAAMGLRHSTDKSDGNQVIQGSALAVRGALLPDQTYAGNFFGFNSLPAYSAGTATDFSATTKRLTLQYQWTPDLMTYVGFSDGYGPGGVTQPPPSVTAYMANVPAAQNDIPGVRAYGEQTLDNFEVGMRADWFGGALRTNVSAFYTDWKNVQVSQYVATTWFDTNGDGRADSQIDANADGRNDIYVFPSLLTVGVAAAKAKGIEFEGSWRPTTDLRFNLNVGWLDTEYTELGAAGQGVIPAVTPGSVFPQAPEFTGNFGAQYEVALANGSMITPRIDYTYTDDFVLATDDLRQRTQKGFGLLNARVTYDSGKNWSVALLGTNLTDEYYLNSGFYTVAEQIDFVTLGRPREYGVTFNFTFE